MIDQHFLKEQLALAKKELNQFVLFQKQLKKELKDSHTSVTKFKQAESFFLSQSIKLFEDRILELKIRIKYNLLNPSEERIQQFILFTKRLESAKSQLHTFEKTQKMFKLRRKNVFVDKNNPELNQYQQSINSKQILKTKNKINKAIFNIKYLTQKLKTIDFNT